MGISAKTFQGELYYSSLSLPRELGKIVLVASDIGLRALVWTKDRSDQTDITKLLDHVDRSNAVIELCKKELREYFDGRRTDFATPLDLIGTQFQLDVWRSLLEIPYGETRSYSWQADQIGRPKAQRAVGSANGKNPVSIIVPCHRAIQKNQSLGGYAGGTRTKQTLLDLEAEQQSGPLKHGINDS